jgi:hypothetical protein
LILLQQGYGAFETLAQDPMGKAISTGNKIDRKPGAKEIGIWLD